MRGGADIVVGTPGRICDLMSTGELKLNEVRHFVLDEADRMLDLGFIRDIRRIVAACRWSGSRRCSPRPCRRRSAGLPKRCCAIRCGWTSPAPPPANCRSSSTCISSILPAKRALLGRLLADPALSRVIVFTRTKRCADRVAETLDTAASGSAPCTATRASRRGRRRWSSSAAAALAFWSRPISPRAAST